MGYWFQNFLLDGSLSLWPFLLIRSMILQIYFRNTFLKINFDLKKAQRKKHLPAEVKFYNLWENNPSYHQGVRLLSMAASSSLVNIRGWSYGSSPSTFLTGESRVFAKSVSGLQPLPCRLHSTVSTLFFFFFFQFLFPAERHFSS